MFFVTNDDRRPGHHVWLFGPFDEREAYRIRDHLNKAAHFKLIVTTPDEPTGLCFVDLDPEALTIQRFVD